MRTERPGPSRPPEGPLCVEAVLPSPDGSAWRIRARGHSLGRVDLDVPSALGLAPGVTLEGAAVAALSAALARRAAYEAGLRLLGRRPYSRAALLGRLRARFGEEAAADAAARLAPHLDDVAFASAWIAARQRLRPAGTFALREGLRRAGVPREVAEAALRAAERAEGPGGERERCLALGRARMARMSGLPPARAAARLGAFLGRRGFRGADIRWTLRALGLPDGGEWP